MCRQVSNQCKPLCLMCVLGLDIGPSRLATSTTELQVKSMQRCQHEQLQRRWVMCCIPSTENNLALHIQWTHECTHTHTHTRTHTHKDTHRHEAFRGSENCLWSRLGNLLFAELYMATATLKNLQRLLYTDQSRCTQSFIGPSCMMCPRAFQTRHS